MDVSFAAKTKELAVIENATKPQVERRVSTIDNIPKPVVNAVAGKQKVVLINHGSFNPVHSHHVQMMEMAKIKMGNNGYDVVQGYLAIAPQRHLVQKGCGIVTDEHRIGAIYAICGGPLSGSWISPDIRGTVCIRRSND